LDKNRIPEDAFPHKPNVYRDLRRPKDGFGFQTYLRLLRGGQRKNPFPELEKAIRTLCLFFVVKPQCE
jgi:hypothetical protein